MTVFNGGTPRAGSAPLVPQFDVQGNLVPPPAKGVGDLYDAFDAAAAAHPAVTSASAGNHVPRHWVLPDSPPTAIPAEPIHEAVRNDEARVVGNFLNPAEIVALRNLVLKNPAYTGGQAVFVPVTSEGVLFTVIPSGAESAHEFRIAQGHVERRQTGESWTIFLRDEAPATLDDFDLTGQMSSDIEGYVSLIQVWSRMDFKRRDNHFVYTALDGGERYYAVRRGDLCRMDMDGSKGRIDIKNLRGVLEAWIRGGRPTNQEPAISHAPEQTGLPAGLSTSGLSAGAPAELSDPRLPRAMARVFERPPTKSMAAADLNHGAVYAMQPVVRYAVHSPVFRPHVLGANPFMRSAGPFAIPRSLFKLR